MRARNSARSDDWSVPLGGLPPAAIMRAFPAFEELEDNALFRLLYFRSGGRVWMMRLYGLGMLLICLPLAAEVDLLDLPSGFLALGFIFFGVQAALSAPVNLRPLTAELTPEVVQDLLATAITPRDFAIGFWGLTASESVINFQRRSMRILGLVALSLLALQACEGQLGLLGWWSAVALAAASYRIESAKAAPFHSLRLCAMGLTFDLPLNSDPGLRRAPEKPKPGTLFAAGTLLLAIPLGLILIVVNSDYLLAAVHWPWPLTDSPLSPILFCALTYLIGTIAGRLAARYHRNTAGQNFDFLVLTCERYLKIRNEVFHAEKG